MTDPVIDRLRSVLTDVNAAIAHVEKARKPNATKHSVRSGREQAASEIAGAIRYAGDALCMLTMEIGRREDEAA